MPPKRAPKSKGSANGKKSVNKDFLWTDDEALLLLNVTHDYKVQHLVDGTCWESVKSKYVDILELFRKELPTTEEEAHQLSKDYPHKPEEITKEILTTKLKAVRTKFREAVDSGRSGHGRVVFLYFELCAKIWGGSPATEQIDTGVETQEINDTEVEAEGSDMPERVEDDFEETFLSEQPAVPSSSGEHSTRETTVEETSSSQTSSSQTSSSQGVAADNESDETIQLGRKRRDQFNENLAGYKQKKLKKVSADSQMVLFAEKEIQLKERMLQQLETITQEQTKTMSMTTTQLSELTNTMTGAFMLLQQAHQQPAPGPFPYQQYSSPYVHPAPSQMMPIPHPTRQFTATTPVRRPHESYIQNNDMYDSQSLFGDEN